MSTALDVLLLETGPGDGASDGVLLADAGHRVHHCYDPDAPAVECHPSGVRACRALTDGTCPLDEHIDVALLVRHGVAPRPFPGETGVRCAVRAGVPVVEDGTDLLDPFAPWIARRTDGEGVVAACEAAARDAMVPALADLRERATSLLREADVDPDVLDATFEVDGDRLVVHLHGPPLPERITQAICVRVVDALRVLPRRFATVDVGWVPTPVPV